MEGNTAGVGDNIVTIHPKVQAHIMLMQVNVKQGLVKYGNKGNEAVLKELRQLYSTKALLPIKKDDMTYNERKRHCSTLCSSRKKRLDN